MNKFDLMREAISEAEHTIRAAESKTEWMADILSHNGRLRSVSPSVLRRLKRELANFNMHTGRWK